MRHRQRWCARVAALLIGCAGAVSPASASDSAPERARIAEQRSAAKAALVEQERACQPQFFVTACVEAARDEQRAVLARLRREELALDEAKRIENAERRRQALADKAAAREARSKDAPLAQPGDATRAASAPPKASPRPRADAASQPARSAAEQARRTALEAENKAKFDERARAAQAHREAIELRNAQRADPGKRGAPLPVPGAVPHVPKPASAP
jgi:hypothetical protein